MSDSTRISVPSWSQELSVLAKDLCNLQWGFTVNNGNMPVLLPGLYYYNDHWKLNSSRPKQNGQHFPSNIFKCFSWHKIFQFCIFIQILLNCELIISLHWVGKWRNAEQATSHYCNQCRLRLMLPYCIPIPQWVILATVMTVELMMRLNDRSLPSSCPPDWNNNTLVLENLLSFNSLAPGKF